MRLSISWSAPPPTPCRRCRRPTRCAHCSSAPSSCEGSTPELTPLSRFAISPAALTEGSRSSCFGSSILLERLHRRQALGGPDGRDGLRRGRGCRRGGSRRRARLHSRPHVGALRHLA